MRFVFSDVTGMVPKNVTENWLILYDLGGSAGNGKTFQVHFDINSYVAAYDTDWNGGANRFRRAGRRPDDDGVQRGCPFGGARRQ